MSKDKLEFKDDEFDTPHGGGKARVQNAYLDREEGEVMLGVRGEKWSSMVYLTVEDGSILRGKPRWGNPTKIDWAEIDQAELDSWLGRLDGASQETARAVLTVRSQVQEVHDDAE